MELLEFLVANLPNMGFPILVSGALFWYMREQMKTHKEETDGLKEVISEMNVMLAGLKQLIEDKL